MLFVVGGGGGCKCNAGRRAKSGKHLPRVQGVGQKVEVLLGLLGGGGEAGGGC